jgi:hypothetical protein
MCDVHWCRVPGEIRAAVARHYARFPGGFLHTQAMADALRLAAAARPEAVL